MITDEETAPPRPWTKRAAISSVLVLREAAQHRGQREQRHPAQEHPLAPHQVAQPAGQQQEAAERDQVGVDDPGQVGLRDVEVALDRRAARRSRPIRRACSSALPGRRRRGRSSGAGRRREWVRLHSSIRHCRSAAVTRWRSRPWAGSGWSAEHAQESIEDDVLAALGPDVERRCEICSAVHWRRPRRR